jgi:polyphosphate kinase 2 (PPK2 family)
VRVHPETMKRQKMPPRLVSKSVWDERLADIAHFEDYISRQGTTILKFFLHVSRKEQKKRFTERLDEPEKNWKFSPSDVMERKFWGHYMEAFEEAIRATASKQAPWFVVPASSSKRRLRMPWVVSALRTQRSMPRSGKSSWRPGWHFPASGSGEEVQFHCR